jgi:hypothetical protein
MKERDLVVVKQTVSDESFPVLLILYIGKKLEVSESLLFSLILLCGYNYLHHT